MMTMKRNAFWEKLIGLYIRNLWLYVNTKERVVLGKKEVCDEVFLGEGIIVQASQQASIQIQDQAISKEPSATFERRAETLGLLRKAFTLVEMINKCHI